MNRQKGFLLLEMLVATALFSMAGSQLFLGFTQSLKAQTRIEKSFRRQEPLRILFLKMENDLRNTVMLKEYPFRGTATEMSFPARLQNADSNEARTQLCLVQYTFQDHQLIRRVRVIASPGGAKQSDEQIASSAYGLLAMTVLKNIASAQFEFPHHNVEEQFSFQPFWIEEPYRGIPRAVLLNLELPKEGEPAKERFSKCISLPQGRMGFLAEEAK